MSATANEEVGDATDGLPEAIVERAARAKAALVILPHRVTEDGRGVYPDPTTFLVKELRAAGVDASFLDEADQRLFEVKNSALLDMLTAVVLGVASSAAWDGFKALIRKRTATAPLTVTYVDLSPEGARREFTATGRADEVLESIDRLRSELPPGKRDV